MPLRSLKRGALGHGLFGLRINPSLTVPMICISVSKRIGNVFTTRWVASSFREISAVKHSFPALAQHFQNASKNETRQSAEKARFQGLLSKLALMADVFND